MGATGVRSLAGSKGILVITLGLMVMVGLAANHSVRPSGLARTTSLPAMVALAPVLFSTMTGMPNSLASAGANSRAPWSTGPPAA